MKTICERDACTGCGACIGVCPRNCIEYELDLFDNSYPKIDTEKCVDCERCIQVCPHLNPVKKNEIFRCYAAWSNDKFVKENSASGGIASELYKFLIEKGFKVVGTEWEGKQVVFKITDKIEEVEKFRNSKYVFSNVRDNYKGVSDLLKNGEKVFFIGLPCQVAAVKNFCIIEKVDMRELILVDLVCHGVVSSQYLISHTQTIERKKKRNVKHIQFRNPQYGTNRFFFTLADKKGIFYKKSAKSDDCYQLAYHRALAYRENCYKCEYACKERIGDISLCDFTSVGKVKEFVYSNENTSCVMVNTDKGMKLWDEVVNSGKVWAMNRPIEEIVNYEKQLRSPSKKHRNRNKFLVKYKRTGNFTKSAQYALKVDILWNVMNYVLPLRQLNDFRKKMKQK